MMRRLLVTTVAVPALLLSACGSDEPEVVESETTSETSATEAPSDDAETTTDAAETTDAEETTTEDSDAETETATDDAAATTGSGGADEGGEEGQAAADRAKEWLVAFVNGDEAVCDYMLDLSSEGPMNANQTDYDMCVRLIPSMAEDMFPAEVAGIIEVMEINGASVDGDTAVVDRDNFSELFAEGLGDEVITLQRVEGEWYVDMNESFNAPTE